MKAFVLLAAVSAAQAAPQWVLPYAAHAVVTGNSVPVSVGGYKAVAGSNGDLAGPVHEVPGLVPALAVHKQESSGAAAAGPPLRLRCLPLRPARGQAPHPE